MKKQTKEERQADLIDSLVYENVLTTKGRFTLYELIYKIGVKRRLSYFNFCEVLVKKELRTSENKYTIKKIVHDRGLEFNNGVLIRKIKDAVFKLPFESKENIEVKERNPDYKPS